jgi:hypothetical protein
VNVLLKLLCWETMVDAKFVLPSKSSTRQVEHVKDVLLDRTLTSTTEIVSPAVKISQ